MRTRYIALVAVIGLSAFALGGCSTQARAERKGKATGDQICKAKSAPGHCRVASRDVERIRNPDSLVSTICHVKRSSRRPIRSRSSLLLRSRPRSS